MSNHADETPKRIDVLIINDDAESPSLLNPISGQIFFTNKVGKQVMELADGSRRAEEIADHIVRRFTGSAPEVIRKEVLGFLDDSGAKGLLTWMRA